MSIQEDYHYNRNLFFEELSQSIGEYSIIISCLLPKYSFM